MIDTDNYSAAADGATIAAAGKANQPFAESDTASFYAGDENRQRQLDLLMHLVPYGGVVVILGESGIGKSALLQQVEKKTSESCRVCVLSAADCIDPRLALKKMLGCFAWQADVDHSLGGTQIKVLREHMGILHDNGYIPVLIVDDADAVTDSVFGVIEQLVNEQADNLLTLVLAGDQSLKERLASPLLQGLQGHISHEIVLTPLSIDEQEDFLRHQLAAAGINGMGPFHKASLKFINVASGGVPRRIKELALVIWTNKQETLATKSMPDLRLWMKQARYVLLIVLVSVGVALFTDEIRQAVFPPSANELTPETSTSKTLAAASAPVDAKPKTQTDTITALIQQAQTQTRSIKGLTAQQSKVAATGLNTETKTTQIDQGQLPQELVELPEPVVGADLAGRDDSNTDAKADDASAVVSVKTAATVAVVDSAVQAAEISSEPVAQKKPDSVAAAINVQRPGGLALDVSRQGDWWLQQSPSNYAVQIMAMDAPAVIAFLQQHGIAAQVSTFRVKTSDKSLLAVVTGPYATKDEADDAAKKWQRQLHGVKPWVRSVASIQQAVNSFREQMQPAWLAQVERNEQHLLLASPQEYSVQLLAMDQAAMMAFISKHNLDQDVEYFRTQSGLYAALMGRYGDREQALAAGHSIAAQVGGIRPWVRSLSSVQTIIRNNRDHPR